MASHPTCHNNRCIRCDMREIRVLGDGRGHICEVCLNSRTAGNAWTLRRALRVALVEGGQVLAEAEVGPDCLEGHRDTLRWILERRVGKPGPYTVFQKDGHLIALFPPDPDLIVAARSIPLARFDRDGGVWVFPAVPEAIARLRVPPLDVLVPDGEIRPVRGSWVDDAVSARDGSLILRLPYDPDCIQAMKAVSGRRWDPVRKAMIIPGHAAGVAAEVVEQFFPDVARRIRELFPDSPPAVAVEPDFVSRKVIVRLAIYLEGARADFRAVGGRWDEKERGWVLPVAGLPTVRNAVRPLRPVVVGPHAGAYLVVSDRDSGTVRILDPDLQEVESVPEGARVSGDLEAFERVPPPPQYLWPYQAGIYPRLVSGNLLLALDVGLGKTVLSIAGLEARHRDRSLVISPASVKWQWAREIGRFAPELPVVVLEGEAEEREAIIRSWMDWGGILITSYDLFRRHSELASVPVSVLIVDEAQRIKTRTAQRTRLIARIQAQYVWALTGTPIENHPIEVYNIMRRVAPTLLPPWPEFEEKHIVRGHFGQVTGFRRLDEFGSRIAPAVVRLRKSDVLQDLPPLRLVERDVVFSGEVLKAYRALESEAVSAVLDYVEASKRREAGQKLAGIRANAMTKILRLRQFCDHPALLGLDLPSPKLDVLQEEVSDLLETEPKVIVFSSFVEPIPHIISRLRPYGAVAYHGGMNDSQREAALSRFTTDDRARVLVSSDAGAEGINLQAASVVVNYDLPWTPARLHQRLGRAHRAGQTRPVLGLILLSPADRPVYELLQRKARLAEAVLGAGGEAAFENPLEVFCQARQVPWTPVRGL